MELDEDERFKRFAEVFDQARNTHWALMIRETIHDLYGVKLTNVSSLRDADAAVRAQVNNPEWPTSVIDRLGIKRITVNHEHLVDFPGLPGVGEAVPIWPDYKEWTQRITEAHDPREIAEEASAAIQADVAAMAARGRRGMRVHAQCFDGFDPEAARWAVAYEPGVLAVDPGEREVQAFLAHTLLAALSEHDMFAQLFLAIHPIPGASIGMAYSDPSRIVNLYPLFDRYDCDFELVSGAPRLNIDIAQAARIYPNVHCGGLWWYNYRASTYRETMQARLEAVPARKSVILASDARCVEWCYTKTLLVKRLLADFLHEQVQGGWINEADALWVANEWLHDAVQRRYDSNLQQATETPASSALDSAAPVAAAV